MTLFTVFDTNPLRTRMRESAAAGKPMFLCGHAHPVVLGDVEATNAANAVLAARARWPHCATEQLYARKKGGSP